MRKEENRMLEEAFLEEVHGMKPGTEWDRVAKNCGFNNKIVHCKKDRNRMRNVILAMKQTAINGKQITMIGILNKDGKICHLMG